MERHNENLSALVDGELDRRESEFLLRRLTTDATMQDDWARYHLVRACMQREFAGRVDLVDRVRDAVADAQTDPVSRMSPLTRFGIGGAMAAGVALMAVVGLNSRLAPGPGEIAAPEAFVSQSSALDRQFSRQAVPVGLSELPASPARTSPDDPRERISRYIIRHGQAAGGSTFATFTPILTSEAQVPETAVIVSEDAETAAEASDPLE